jgi:BNR repeat-like domain
LNSNERADNRKADMKSLPVAVLLFLGFAGTPQIQAADAIRVVPAGSVAHPRQPQAAVDEKGVIYVAFGAKNTIYCSVSRDSGRSYGRPVKVGETKHLALGARRGPRIVAGGGTVVIVTCDHSNGLLSARRSTDGGRTWKKPVTINDNKPGTASEGLHALAMAPNGTLYCAWLDHRLDRKNQIFGAASSDGGRTWSKNRLIYRTPSGGVCPCCHPSATFDPKGNLYVMWRNALDGFRDMYLIVSRDGGKTFGTAAKLGIGAWRLDRCPMDGGAIAVASPGKVTTVWRRRKQVFRLDSVGEREQLLGTGEQAWAAATPRGTWLVWLTRRQGDLWLQSPTSTRPEKLAAHATDPVVATPRSGKGPVVVVWETGSGREQTILARVVKE